MNTGSKSDLRVKLESRNELLRVFEDFKSIIKPPIPDKEDDVSKTIDQHIDDDLTEIINPQYILKSREEEKPCQNPQDNTSLLPFVEPHISFESFLNLGDYGYYRDSLRESSLDHLLKTTIRAFYGATKNVISEPGFFNKMTAIPHSRIIDKIIRQLPPDKYVISSGIGTDDFHRPKRSPHGVAAVVQMHVNHIKEGRNASQRKKIIDMWAALTAQELWREADELLHDRKESKSEIRHKTTDHPKSRYDKLLSIYRKEKEMFSSSTPDDSAIDEDIGNFAATLNKQISVCEDIPLPTKIHKSDDQASITSLHPEDWEYETIKNGDLIPKNIVDSSSREPFVLPKRSVHKALQTIRKGYYSSRPNSDNVPPPPQLGYSVSLTMKDNPVMSPLSPRIMHNLTTPPSGNEPWARGLTGRLILTEHLSHHPLSISMNGAGCRIGRVFRLLSTVRTSYRNIVAIKRTDEEMQRLKRSDSSSGGVRSSASTSSDKSEPHRRSLSGMDEKSSTSIPAPFEPTHTFRSKIDPSLSTHSLPSFPVSPHDNLYTSIDDSGPLPAPPADDASSFFIMYNNIHTQMTVPHCSPEGMYLLIPKRMTPEDEEREEERKRRRTQRQLREKSGGREEALLQEIVTSSGFHEKEGKEEEETSIPVRSSRQLSSRSSFLSSCSSSSPSHGAIQDRFDIHGEDSCEEEEEEEKRRSKTRRYKFILRRCPVIFPLGQCIPRDRSIFCPDPEASSSSTSFSSTPVAEKTDAMAFREIIDSRRRSTQSEWHAVGRSTIPIGQTESDPSHSVGSRSKSKSKNSSPYSSSSETDEASRLLNLPIGDCMSMYESMLHGQRMLMKWCADCHCHEYLLEAVLKDTQREKGEKLKLYKNWLCKIVCTMPWIQSELILLSMTHQSPPSLLEPDYSAFSKTKQWRGWRNKDKIGRLIGEGNWYTRKDSAMSIDKKFPSLGEALFFFKAPGTRKNKDEEEGVTTNKRKGGPNKKASRVSEGGVGTNRDLRKAASDTKIVKEMAFYGSKEDTRWEEGTFVRRLGRISPFKGHFDSEALQFFRSQRQNTGKRATCVARMRRIFIHQLALLHGVSVGEYRIHVKGSERWKKIFSTRSTDKATDGSATSAVSRVGTSDHTESIATRSGVNKRMKAVEVFVNGRHITTIEDKIKDFEASNKMLKKLTKCVSGIDLSCMEVNSHIHAAQDALRDSLANAICHTHRRSDTFKNWIMKRERREKESRIPKDLDDYSKDSEFNFFDIPTASSYSTTSALLFSLSSSLSLSSAAACLSSLMHAQEKVVRQIGWPPKNKGRALVVGKRRVRPVREEREEEESEAESDSDGDTERSGVRVGRGGSLASLNDEILSAFSMYLQADLLTPALRTMFQSTPTPAYFDNNSYTNNRFRHLIQIPIGLDRIQERVKGGRQAIEWGHVENLCCSGTGNPPIVQAITPVATPAAN
ncbi:hypothetical protein ADUPG1_014234, partial [Aduncisulcus paluster]